jgi:hypothetical protein
MKRELVAIEALIESNRFKRLWKTAKRDDKTMILRRIYEGHVEGVESWVKLAEDRV